MKGGARYYEQRAKRWSPWKRERVGPGLYNVGRMPSSLPVFKFDKKDRKLVTSPAPAAKQLPTMWTYTPKELESEA